ncbi:MAG: type II toxin-antitoxin system RelE/ParE family toxin [Luteolibacter sp.]
MDKSVFVAPAARNDLEQAFQWYEVREEGLGLRFLDAVERAFTQISKRGESFAVRVGNYRRIQLEVFPYAIYFKIKPDRAVVNLVVHTARNPSFLSRRLRN